MNLTIDNADPLIVDKFNFNVISLFGPFWVHLILKLPKSAERGYFQKGTKYKNTEVYYEFISD